jgi:hypothetical protein
METSRWTGLMLLSSAVMTSCRLVWEGHCTEEGTALSCGSYKTTWAYLCAPTFQRNTMGRESMVISQYIISRD